MISPSARDSGGMMAGLSDSAESYLSGVQYTRTTSQAVTVKIQRQHKEYQRKLRGYEKEYSISLSRIAARERELRDSMIAYSDHAHTVRKQREQRLMGTESLADPLVSGMSTMQINGRSNRRSRHLPKLHSEHQQGKQDIRQRQEISPVKLTDPVADEMLGQTPVSPPYQENDHSGSHSRVVSTMDQAPLNKGEFQMKCARASDLGDILRKDHKGHDRTAFITQPTPSAGEPVKRPRKKRFQPGTLPVDLGKTWPVSGGTDSVAGTVGSNESTCSTMAGRRRAEQLAKRLLREAVDKLRQIDTGLQHEQREDALKALLLPKVRGKNKRLVMPSSSLDAIPEDDQEGRLTRISAMRKRQVTPVAEHSEHDAYINRHFQSDTQAQRHGQLAPISHGDSMELYPDRASSHRSREALAERLAFYESEMYGSGTRGQASAKRLQARARQRAGRRPKKLKYLKA